MLNPNVKIFCEKCGADVSNKAKDFLQGMWEAGLDWMEKKGGVTLQEKDIDIAAIVREETRNIILGREIAEPSEVTGLGRMVGLAIFDFATGSIPAWTLCPNCSREEASPDDE
jgi:hypothetical protein